MPVEPLCSGGGSLFMRRVRRGVYSESPSVSVARFPAAVLSMFRSLLEVRLSGGVGGRRDRCGPELLRVEDRSGLAAGPLRLPVECSSLGNSRFTS